MILNKIAVLITCHNRKDKTLSCLKALYNNKLLPCFSFDVFLVDDGCSDGTVQAVNLHFPLVKIIPGDGDLYWSRGMHKAWDAAASNYDYDYYLWLNDDTFIFENGLNNLLKQAKDQQNSSIIVAATCSKYTNTITYSGIDANGNRLIPNGSYQEVFSINGNCVLVPSKVYKEVGNLDLLFHHGLGDHDYGYRALNRNFKSFLSADYLAYCEKNDTLPKWCLKSVKISERIKNLYSPLASSQPYPYFRYKLRHFGLIVALKHMLTIHLRLIFPGLWSI